MMRQIRKWLVGVVLVAAVAACEEGNGPAGPEVPSPPAGVTATVVSSSSVMVSWSAVAGATSYTIQRAAAGGAFANAGTSTTTSYTDTGLNPGTEYRYRVAATTSGGTSDYSGEVVAQTQAGLRVAVIDTDITANRTLYADTVYTIKGFIKVANGATLTIQPGTRIEGDYETVGSSLFVLRGAKIMAVGTAAQPIVFTSARPVGQRRPGDWGGLILVGNARINRTGTINIEGTGTGPTNPPVDYGNGTNDADNSGELRYVRVEFAGYGPSQDTELNSFTFAAIGSGTKLEYLQSMSGLDDSFEWFGGTVDAKYLVSYESGDDHFDASEGYSGRVQYMIAYQSKVLQPRPGAGNVSSDPQGIENDGCAGPGCTNGQESQPYTMPLFANFTLIGTGAGVVDATSGGYGVVLRRGTGGHYVNGLVARWPKAAISIRDGTTGGRINAGLLSVSNVLTAENGALFQSGQITVDAGANALESASLSAAALLSGLPFDPNNADRFDWTPPAGSSAAAGGLAAFTGPLAAKAGTFVSATAYRGAADPNGPKWWQGWTTYADN
jgi:hypothetical protein